MSESPSLSSRIGALLDVLRNSGGTDLHISVGMTPQVRIDGVLRPVAGHPVVTSYDAELMLAELLTAEQNATAKEHGEYDFAFDWRADARVRASAFHQRGFVSIALRMVPRRVPTLTELGMPAVITELTRMHQGLILITGPTGSGKTTTLAAMVNQINNERACHIITIEDPIEYVHDHNLSIVNQREVGRDTPTFGGALRAALRSDPDVVLVGEMRDLESIAAALTIAETGHLVLATLHTNDAAQTLARIIDVFPNDQQAQVRAQLAGALTSVIYQRLIPRIGRGMVAAHEVLIATTAVRNLIKEAKTHQLRNAMLTGSKDGMSTLEQSLNTLVKAGVVSYDEAVVRSLYPKEIEVAERA